MKAARETPLDFQRYFRDQPAEEIGAEVAVGLSEEEPKGALYDLGLSLLFWLLSFFGFETGARYHLSGCIYGAYV